IESPFPFSPLRTKTMRPDIDQINNNMAWDRRDFGGTWVSAEGIEVKGAYHPEDLSEVEHLGYSAGIPPYLRGPYSTMYVVRPWTIRQYAGFSTAEESNAFYRTNLA